jgi:hypothetical protein
MYPSASNTTVADLFKGFGGREAPSSIGKLSTVEVPSATLGTGSSDSAPKSSVTR